MLKPLTVWITTNCGKFLEIGIPDDLTCLLRNLYAGQEAIIRIGHGTTNWFKVGKGVCQGCILSPCLLNLYAECAVLSHFSHVQLFAALWTITLFMGFFRYTGVGCHALLQYAEYIMRNAALDESQARTATAWRNINSLRYPDDTTVMAESGEEPESLFMGNRSIMEQSIPGLHFRKMLTTPTI